MAGPKGRISRIYDVELYMECHDEPLSHKQHQVAKKATADYNKSQELIAAARSGRLVFLPDGKTKILKHPFGDIPELNPGNAKPILPPTPPKEKSNATAVANKYQMVPATQAKSNKGRTSSGRSSPDIIFVAETRMSQSQPKASPKQTIKKAGPSPKGIGAGKSKETVQLLESSAIPTSELLIDPVTVGNVSSAQAMAQSNALATLRNEMQTQAFAKADNDTDTQKKRSRKHPQLEGCGPGNWVPLDEFYYGKMEGNPAYQETKGEYRFKCWYCNKMLYNNVAAMMHMQGHIDSDRQVNLDITDLTQCKHCFKQFDTPFEMQTHMEKVHMNNTNVLLCRICEKDHATRELLKDHMKRNHNACEMPYICQLCNFRSSMYSDAVDHFKKKHTSSEFFLCLYCLRVFHVRFVQQGWGQTTVFYNHLLKHQMRNSTKKCLHCKLIFLNAQDLKDHRRKDHLPNQKGVIGMSAKYTTPHQVMIKVAEPSPTSTKSGSGIKSLNVPSVCNVMQHSLVYPGTIYKAHCVECQMLMGMPDHYKQFIHCSMCRFATSCSFAYSNHMMGFHSGQLTAASTRTPTERPLTDQMYCSCGFVSSYGNMIANHLVSCSKRSCYSEPPDHPDKSHQGGFEHVMMKDPRKKPGASLLDVLGLVKKDSLPRSRPFSVEESPPPSPVEMPEVNLDVPPPRRPSLLRDSMKKSFKNILKKNYAHAKLTEEEAQRTESEWEAMPTLTPFQSTPPDQHSLLPIEPPSISPIRIRAESCESENDSTERVKCKQTKIVAITENVSQIIDGTLPPPCAVWALNDDGRSSQMETDTISKVGDSEMEMNTISKVGDSEMEMNTITKVGDSEMEIDAVVKVRDEEIPSLVREADFKGCTEEEDSESWEAGKIPQLDKFESESEAVVAMGVGEDDEISLKLRNETQNSEELKAKDEMTNAGGKQEAGSPSPTSSLERLNKKKTDSEDDDDFSVRGTESAASAVSSFICPQNIFEKYASHLSHLDDGVKDMSTCLGGDLKVVAQRPAMVKDLDVDLKHDDDTRPMQPEASVRMSEEEEKEDCIVPRHSSSSQSVEGKDGNSFEGQRYDGKPDAEAEIEDMDMGSRCASDEDDDESKPETRTDEDDNESKPETRTDEDDDESKPETRAVEDDDESKPENRAVEDDDESKPENRAVVEAMSLNITTKEDLNVAKEKGDNFYIATEKGEDLNVAKERGEDLNETNEKEDFNIAKEKGEPSTDLIRRRMEGEREEIKNIAIHSDDGPTGIVEESLLCGVEGTPSRFTTEKMEFLVEEKNLSSDGKPTCVELNDENNKLGSQATGENIECEADLVGVLKREEKEMEPKNVNRSLHQLSGGENLWSDDHTKTEEWATEGSSEYRLPSLSSTQDHQGKSAVGGLDYNPEASSSSALISKEDEHRHTSSAVDGEDEHRYTSSAVDGEDEHLNASTSSSVNGDRIIRNEETLVKVSANSEMSVTASSSSEGGISSQQTGDAPPTPGTSSENLSSQGLIREEEEESKQQKVAASSSHNVHGDRERSGRGRSRSRSRSRDKYRERDRKRDGNRDRPRDRDHQRNRDRDGDRYRSRSGHGDHYRDQSRDKDRYRDQERRRDKDRSRNRSKDRSRNRSRDSRDRSRNRSRERSRNRSRERSRNRSRDRSRNRSRDRSREKERSRDGDRKYRDDRKGFR